MADIWPRTTVPYLSHSHIIIHDNSRRTDWRRKGRRQSGESYGCGTAGTAGIARVAAAVGTVSYIDVSNAYSKVNTLSCHVCIAYLRARSRTNVASYKAGDWTFKVGFLQLAQQCAWFAHMDLESLPTERRSTMIIPFEFTLSRSYGIRVLPIDSHTATVSSDKVQATQPHHVQYA